ITPPNLSPSLTRQIEILTSGLKSAPVSAAIARPSLGSLNLILSTTTLRHLIDADDTDLDKIAPCHRSFPHVPALAVEHFGDLLQRCDRRPERRQVFQRVRDGCLGFSRHRSAPSWLRRHA